MAGAAPGFARRLIEWQAESGRHDLPWQGTRDPYRIWLSEVMLQQTQVATVVPYYLRFLERFPDLRSLARAPLDDVLAAWSGLGYYSRGRNLHRAAIEVSERHGGRFPRGRVALQALPGVGRSTAAAISVFAFGEREAILDGNVQRVLARHFALEGYPGGAAAQKHLWTLAESLLPASAVDRYTQALMDLGATVCLRARPKCGDCPLRGGCRARREDRIGELPAPRPRKPLPRRATVMLVLRRGDALLLLKRAPTGVWGGMWSLPECASVPAALRDAASRFGCEVASHRMLDTIEHGFTHFLLAIRPLACEVRAAPARAAEPGIAWMTAKQALASGIPAPVRALISRLQAA